jgi:hypothetical protein
MSQFNSQNPAYLGAYALPAAYLLPDSSHAPPTYLPCLLQQLLNGH